MVSFRFLSCLLFLSMAFSGIFPQMTLGQSFNCQSARLQAEKTICSGRWLSELDERLEKSYQQLRNRLGAGQKRKLARTQKNWLRARNQCKRNRRCLRSQYNDRLADIRAQIARLDGKGLRDHPGPSFDCDYARRASEVTICTHRNIANLDRRLAGMFSDALRMSRGNGDRRNLMRDQAQWIKARNACRYDRACLRRSYHNRIQHLDAVIADLNSRPVVRPTFDCRGAKLRSEKAICRSERLAKLDIENGRLYKKAIRSAPSLLMREDLRESGRAWLKQRNRCRSDRECLTNSYFGRIIYLENLLYYFNSTPKTLHKGPSFDCRSVRLAAEKTICNRKNLSRLDRQMASTYEALQKEIPRAARASLRREQAAWLKTRNGCSSDRACLRQKYRKRISDLEFQLDEFNDRDWNRRVKANPSFNCKYARLPAESSVCDNAVLAALDREMAAAYYALRDRTSSARKRSRLKAQQTVWLARRNKCGYRVNCLRDRYENRLYQLETALDK